MYIISIDIGFEHFAIIGANVSEYYKLEDVTLCKLINIKNLMLECSDTDCELKHTLCISDYMAHLFKMYHDFFEKANTILIERQPPQGFVAVQELILFKYRDKAILVSPNSMHKHFSMSKVQKLRKMFTEKFSKERLQSFPDYSNNERKHDMGDAYCLLVYYLSELRSTPEGVDRSRFAASRCAGANVAAAEPKITSRYFTGGEATQSATNFSQFIYNETPIKPFRLKNLLYTVQDRD
jgi:hypothetical protein